MHAENARQWVHVGSGLFALLLRWLTPWQASGLAAFVETIPVRLDDNISVPAAAAGVLWLTSLMDRAAFDAARASVIAALPWAIGVNGLTAFIGYRARTVSRAGAIAGALVESALGATLEGPGILNNDMLNFINTAVAAAVALALA